MRDFPVSTGAGPVGNLANVCLQRLDLDFAELDCALLLVGADAMLQRDYTFVMLTVLNIDSLHAVEHDNEMGTLCHDLIHVPFTGGFRHRLDLGNIDNRAGAIRWFGALVENVDLVAGGSGDFL